MARFLRFALFVALTILPGLWASGQVKFTTVVSSQDVGRSDYLQVEFVVENAKQIDDLTPPEFSGFHIIQGPIQSSGVSIVNGAMSQYKALSFVLEPTKTGKFTIGGAEATVDGKHMRSNAVTVNVHPGGSGNNSANSGGAAPANPFGSPFFQPSMPDPFGPSPGEVDRDYVLKPGENIMDKIHKNLFVKIQVSKNSCYVGEPIVATYKLYTRVSSESRVTKNPSLNGFSVYDMIEPGSDAVSVEKINGKNFTVHTIRKTQLIPLQAGTIDLDPVEVENTVHFVKKAGRQGQSHGPNSIQDLFDQLTDDADLGPEVAQNVTLDTKPLPITVKPLPEENKPAAFNGAVGSFSIEATLNNRSVSVEDEATLHVVVKGKGNLPVIAPPVINWPAGIEAFDPTTKEDVNKTVAPMSGSKSFDYVITPRNPGHYTIPAVSFPYFDPAAQTYKTAESQPLEIQVTPASRSNSRPAAIANAAKTASPSMGIIGLARDHLEWVFFILLLASVAIYFWRQNLQLRKASLARTQSQAGTAAPPSAATAPKGTPSPAASPSTTVPVKTGRQPDQEIPGMATAAYVPAAPPADPLQEARQLFDNGDTNGFYREVNRAVWKAISNKLDLPASELNKQNTLRQLQLRGWHDTALLSLENLLGECEMNLYTPAYDRWNMQQLLRQAEWVLERLS
jgi:oxygen tolerance protein BatD